MDGQYLQTIQYNTVQDSSMLYLLRRSCLYLYNPGQIVEPGSCVLNVRHANTPIGRLSALACLPPIVVLPIVVPANLYVHVHTYTQTVQHHFYKSIAVSDVVIQ